MRHEVLTHRGGDVRQPRRRGRRRARDGCQARPAGDSAGAAEEDRAALRRGASWPDASRKGAVCGSHIAQTAPFRHVAARGGRGAQPPASLRGTMKSGPTGQMRSSNPPPGCGGGLRQGRPGRRARPHGKTQWECTQIGENGLLTLVWGICVHCCERVALGDTSVSTTMGCLRHRWSPASAGHPQHTERRPDVRSMRLSGSFLSACLGCPSRTLPLRSE